MTATTGVGGLIYGRALVDQRTGKKINFDDLKPDVVKQLVAQAQVDRNDEIYRRQREMKEQLSLLTTLNEVRAFTPGD